MSTCSDLNNIDPGKVHLIVEAKQQKETERYENNRRKNFEAAYAKYSNAVSNKGVILLNYDELPDGLDIPGSAHVLGNFRPNSTNSHKVLHVLCKTYLDPVWPSVSSARPIIIIDLSGSVNSVGPKLYAELEKQLSILGNQTAIYATVANEFFEMNSSRALAELTAGLLCGSESAETICREVLQLEQVAPIDNAVFITDLEGEHLESFRRALAQCNAPSWLNILSIVTGTRLIGIV